MCVIDIVGIFGRDGDVYGRAEFVVFGDGDVRRVVYKFGFNFGIDVGVFVVCGVCLLVENVVVMWGLFMCVEMGGERVVVNYEGDVASVYVRVERVNGFDDRFVVYFGVGVIFFVEGVDLRYYVCVVYIGGEWVEWDFVFDVFGANVGVNFLYVRFVDFIYREAVEAIVSYDDGLDFVCGLYFFVVFVVDVFVWFVSCGEGFYEGFFVFDGFVYCFDVFGGDDFRDRIGDVFDGVFEGIFIGYVCVSVLVE